MPGRPRLRVLLAQNLTYLPGYGGAAKANRLMLEELAARGHDCAAVATLAAGAYPSSVADLLAHLAGLGIRPESTTGAAVVFTHRRVRVHVATAAPRLVQQVRRAAAEMNPDWILVPSDDPGQLVLAAAHLATPGRVVYLAHTMQQLPFGPRSFYPSRRGCELVRRCAGVVAVSRTMARHLANEAAIDSTVIYPMVYGGGPHPRLGRPDAGSVTMVNPCAVKGLAILLGLADACPDVSFVAVPTWGTSAADRAELARRRNLEVVAPTGDIASLFARARILLMPSLWDETFGYTAVEAMLHGVPVMASDIGGLAEAKLGVPSVLPVRPITGYLPQDGDEPYPRAVVPEQDLGPWLAALRRLLGDPAHYAGIADQGVRAATEFLAGLDAGALEDYLATLIPSTAAGPVR